MTSNTEIVAIVKDAFRQYRRYLRRHDVGALSEGWLADSKLIEAYWLAGDVQTAEAKGYAVEALLYWVAERLRGEGNHSWVDYSWRLYNIVYHYRLQGGKVSDLVEKIGIGEDMFYKSGRHANDVVAELLLRELRENGDFFGRKKIAILRRYNRLPHNLQNTLNHLSILQTPVSSNLFNSTHLQQLRQHNLILTEKLVIHSEIQTIVAEQIEPATKVSLHQAAADYYLAEHNYLEACHHCRLANQAERAIELLITHQEQIFVEEAIERLQVECQALDGERVSAETRAQLQLVIGRVALWLDNVQNATKAFRQAIGSTNLSTQAAAYYYLGRTLQETQIDAALQHFTRAIALLRGQAKPILARAYIDRAWIFLRERVELNSAERNLIQAEASIAQLPQNPAIVSDLHNAWGQFYKLQKDIKAATEHAWQAWQLAHEVRDTRRIMNTAHNLGVLYFDQQQAMQALPYLTDCLEEAQKTNNSYFTGASLMHIGGCHYFLGDYAKAHQLYQQAYQYFKSAGVASGCAICCYNLAEVLVETGDVAKARQFYEDGLAWVHNSNMESYLQLLEQLGRQYVELSAELTSHEQKVINYTRRHSKITNKQARNLLNLTGRQVSRILDQLCKQGILQRLGRGRAIHYILS